MKKILFVAVAIVSAALFAVSCTDNNGESDVEDIVGLWQRTWSKGVEYYVDETGTPRSDEWNGVPEETGTIEFKSNGTYLTYLLRNDKEYVLDESGRWSISGNILTILEAGETDADEITVKKLTKTDLVLYFEESDETGYVWQETTFKRIK